MTLSSDSQNAAPAGKTIVPKEKPNPIPTVIVDGIWASPNRWSRLRLRIESEVGPCKAWHYNSSGTQSLEELGARLVSELRALDGPFHAVGFSMGGLIIREAHRQDPNLPLRRVVLLNSPHRGSLMAHLLPLSACRDMRPGSPFLRRLDASPWDFPTLVTWCPADLMILPGSSARWARATQVVRIDIPAHDWPVLSRSLHRKIVQFLTTR